MDAAQQARLEAEIKSNTALKQSRHPHASLRWDIAELTPRLLSQKGWTLGRIVPLIYELDTWVPMLFFSIFFVRRLLLFDNSLIMLV